MEFLYIEENAVRTFIQNSKMQSHEFIEASRMATFLKHGSIDKNFFAGIYFKAANNGYYLFSNKPNIKKALVFDFNYFKGFHERKEDEIVTIFQKILRFSVRFWDNLPLSACEKYITQGDHSLGLVFPFPWVATKGVYRILIEKNPLPKREAKRDVNNLLVLDDSNEERNISPQYTLYRKAIEGAGEACRAESLEENVVDSRTGPIEVHTLDGDPGQLSMYMGYDSWMHHLSESQRKFIFKNVGNRPERLVGAAGTGKTISMVLRCIHILKEALNSGENIAILFITHSKSSKDLIKSLLETNYPEIVNYYDSNYSPVYVHVETLQEWCIQSLNLNLSFNEVLDRDAQDSKAYQLMYLEETLNDIMENHFSTYEPLLSPVFLSFLIQRAKDEVLEMLQFEVSVVIKGRASENIEKYKKLSRSQYIIPVSNEIDINFLYLIFKEYQARLSKVGVFDTDDIVLTSLNQLDTPIWRRRRENIGYNVLFIDETHLFNINELSIFHHLCKNETSQNIIYAIDRSQAVGDRGLSNEMLDNTVGLKTSAEIAIYKTVFRCSPYIVDLAFKILSSGATLFTNFDNPLESMQYSFTSDDERKAEVPEYYLVESEDVMIDSLILKVEKLANELNISRSRILIIATTDELLKKCERKFNEYNKPLEILKARNDISLVRTAASSNRFILSHIDYIGGLEFDAVVIFGVDKNRVPPSENDLINDSSHFSNYAWHNRMYVAVTRAKYRVVMYGEKSRGISKVLNSAIESRFVNIN